MDIHVNMLKVYHAYKILATSEERLARRLETRALRLVDLDPVLLLALFGAVVQGVAPATPGQTEGQAWLLFPGVKLTVWTL